MFFYNKDACILEEVESKNIPEKAVIIDFISDLHIESYSYLIDSEIKDRKELLEDLVNKFIDLMEARSKLLVIGGDLANSNSLSILFLEKALDKWDEILLIPGNHDWYKQDVGQDRYQDLIDLVEKSSFGDKIHFLKDRVEVFEYQGIKIAGAMMMYNINDKKAYFFYKFLMNDGKFIKEDYVRRLHVEDIDYYNKTIDKVHVFLSHVPLIHFIKGVEHLNYNRCFHNDSVELRDDVLYVQGHNHQRASTLEEAKGDLNAINVSLGYGFENLNKGEKSIKVTSVAFL